MSPQLVAILVLALVFLVSTTRSINMGAIAFAAAFGVGTLVADMDADAIFAGFPGDLFVVLVGVTYLFAIAKANGTTDWLVRAAVRLVGGRLALLPWVMFVLTGALTAIGDNRICMNHGVGDIAERRAAVGFYCEIRMLNRKIFCCLQMRGIFLIGIRHICFTEHF